MKQVKLLKNSLLLTLVLLLCGCTDKKFYLDEENYENSNFVEITKDDLKIKEDNKESFLVFVYLNGCISCNNFKNVLNDFIEDKTLTIYEITLSEIKETSISDYVKYSPSMVIYKNGKVKEYLDAACDEDIPCYETKEGLEEWLSKYIYLEKAN